MSVTFELPDELNAAAPPERRGLRRDQVRLMVLDRRTGQTAHSRFDRIGEYLRPGDLLVLNNSRTIPAVLTAHDGEGRPVEVRLAHRLGADRWRALLLGPELAPGTALELDGGLKAVVEERPAGEPLAVIRFSVCCTPLYDALYRLGQPVRYEYIREPWDLDYYQTVYASAPGSVEMPSAGRAFSWELLLKLRRMGVQVGFLSLHAGLSYYPGARKDPRHAPEEYTLPPETAALINQTRAAGGRVIAVGTTVVRTLESAAGPGGRVVGGEGWAGLFIDARHRLQVVDGLLTGLHEPEASHLDLLSAFIRPELLAPAYQEAIARGYLWHEFGDTNLIV